MSEQSESALQTITAGAGVVLFGTFLQLALSFLGKALMARFLELDQYGFVSLGIIAINFGATVSLLGLDQGVARYLPRFEESKTASRTVYFSYALALVMSLLIGLALYLTADTVSIVVFDDPRLETVLRAMAVGIPCWTVVDLGIGTTRGLSETAPRVYVKNVTLPLSRFLFVAVALVLGYETLGVASAYVASYAVAAILITYVVIRRFRPTIPRLKQDERELFSFSVPLTFSNLSSLLYRNVDIVLVGIIAGAGEVAVYNVAYPLARLLLVGTGAFGFLLTPVISSLESEGNLSDAERVYQVITKWLLIMVSPMFAMMVLFPEMAISIPFGTKYSDGALTLVVLATAFFLTNVTGLSRNVLSTIGYPRAVMATDVTAMVVNVALNLLLIPRYGFLGAGIATAVTYLGRDFANGILLYRWADIQPFTASMLRPTFFTAGAVAIIYLPVRLLLTMTIPVLAGTGTALLAIYAVAILRLGGVEQEDIMMFNTIENHAGVSLAPVRATLRRLMR